MKTPEEIYGDECVIKEKGVAYIERRIDIIKQAQDEAYNQAITDALQKVEAYENGKQNTRVVKSILKLKK